VLLGITFPKIQSDVLSTLKLSLLATKQLLSIDNCREFGEKSRLLTATGSTATISDEKTKHSAKVIKNPEPIIPATASPYITGPIQHTLLYLFIYLIWKSHKSTQSRRKK